MARMFEPKTERGRVYAACVDTANAESYLLEPDEWQDAECRLIARAFCESFQIDAVEHCMAWIVANAHRLSADETLAAVNVVRPGAAWWFELCEEQRGAVR